ncbi:Ubiquinone biosynthesis O-methyltransferase, partial [Ananas comosus]
MALRSLRLPRDLCKTLRLLHRTPLQNPNPYSPYSPSPSVASAYPSLLQWRSRSDAAPQIPIKESGEEGKGGSGSDSFASSLNPAEVAKFAAIAETWRDPYSARPLEGLKIIDVGCGGGILSESTDNHEIPVVKTMSFK